MKNPVLRVCAVASSVSLGALLVLRASGGCSSPQVAPEPSAVSAPAPATERSSASSGSPEPSAAVASASSQPSQAPAFFQGSKAFGDLPDTLPTKKGGSTPEFFGGSKAPPPMLPSAPRKPTNVPNPAPNQAP